MDMEEMQPFVQMGSLEGIPMVEQTPERLERMTNFAPFIIPEDAPADPLDIIEAGWANNSDYRKG